MGVRMDVIVYAAYLKTDSHDHIWMPLLRLVGFYSWIDELDELIEDSLQTISTS